MSQLLKTSKALYRALLNPDGTWAEKPHGILQRKDLPEDHLRFLRRYLEFMLHSKLLNDAAKIYIKSPYMTAKAALLAPGENRHFEPGENSQFQPGRNRQSVPGGCSQPRFGYRF